VASVARAVKSRRRRRHYEPGDPYAAGFDAAMSVADQRASSASTEQNPYRTGTDFYSLWVAGFRYAMNADEDE